MDELPYKKYVFVALPYSGVISFLYLYGYWGSFHINVLEFINFSDLAKLALFPFVASFASFPFAFLTGQFLTWKVLPAGGGANSALGRAGRKYWYVLVLLNLVIILSIYRLGTEPEKWLWIALFFSMYSVSFTHSKIMIELIPEPNTRGFILFLAVLAVGMALFIGKNEAHRVTTGYGPNLIDVERSKLALKSDDKNPVTYLGRISEFFALYESATQNIILIKTKEDTPLFIKPNPKK